MKTQDVGPFSLSISFRQDANGNWTIPHAMAVTGRGKIGTDLADILYEMGVVGSKIMQLEVE